MRSHSVHNILVSSLPIFADECPLRWKRRWLLWARRKRRRPAGDGWQRGGLGYGGLVRFEVSIQISFDRSTQRFGAIAVALTSTLVYRQTCFYRHPYVIPGVLERKVRLVFILYLIHSVNYYHWMVRHWVLSYHLTYREETYQSILFEKRPMNESDAKYHKVLVCYFPTRIKPAAYDNKR